MSFESQLEHKQKEFLDRFPGQRHKTEKEYPGIKHSTQWGGSLYTNWGSNHDTPDKIYENDWIPSALAAAVCNVSKQAISDRIRRGTTPHKEATDCRGYGSTVKLVRLMDCRKKKKAGRPKRAKAKTPNKIHTSGQRINETQTTVDDFQTEPIRVKGTILDEERYQQMLAVYESGQGLNRVYERLEWPEADQWDYIKKCEVFDNFIDWAYKTGHLK